MTRITEADRRRRALANARAIREGRLDPYDDEEVMHDSDECEPPETWLELDEEDVAPDRPEPSTLTTVEDYERQLRREGLGELREETLDREADLALRRRPGKTPDLETLDATYSNQRAAGITEASTVELFGKRYRSTGKKRSRAKATKVIATDGDTDYMKIGNDEAAVRDYLGERDYTAALASGKPDADASKLRFELGEKVKELRARGATVAAIATVLGCSERTIGRLG